MSWGTSILSSNSTIDSILSLMPSWGIATNLKRGFGKTTFGGSSALFELEAFTQKKGNNTAKLDRIYINMFAIDYAVHDYYASVFKTCPSLSDHSVVLAGRHSRAAERSDRRIAVWMTKDARRPTLVHSFLHTRTRLRGNLHSDTSSWHNLEDLKLAFKDTSKLLYQSGASRLSRRRTGWVYAWHS